MFITDTELKGDGASEVAIYWIGDEARPRQFGVCFQGGYFNIVRQSLAESVPLAMEVADAAIKEIPDADHS